MNSLKTLFFLLLIAIPVQSLASSINLKQINAVIIFYEAVNNTKSSTVDDFIALFGENNEAELELILYQNFPGIALNDNWQNNQEAVNYTNKVYTDPKKYPSRFLECIKSNEPELFTLRNKHYLEFPPNRKEDFNEIVVVTRDNKVTFRFLNSSPIIEDIVLPSGNSIYSLSGQCWK